MRRLVLWYGILMPLVLVSGGGSSPVNPVKAQPVQLLPFRHMLESRTFAGQERAAIIVIGSGRTAMGLYVFDGHGNCVTWDDMGSPSTKDDLAVEWFPPQTEHYLYEVRNLGHASNEANLVVK